MFKKKEKYVKKVGITGVGEDYNVYEMSITEKIISYLIGFVVGGLAMQIMFGSLIASFIIGFFIGFAVIPICRKFLQNRREKKILLQFKEMLDALSNSFSAGKNTTNAFTDCFSDMSLAYGKESPIVKEISIIINGLNNNFEIEDLLKDMAVRTGLEDIKSFADTFSVCNRLGGNLKRVVSETRNIISDKIEIEMEIQTTVSSNKNEINIMSVMPFVIVSMMGLMGQSAITANTPLNIAVKIFAMVIFIVAYLIGRKMTDIKV